MITSHHYTAYHQTPAQKHDNQLKLFSAKGRIGRFAYFFYSIVIPFLFFWVIAAFAGFLGKLGTTGSLLGYLFLALAIISTLLIFTQLTIQRCHDFNANGWISLLILLPFASLLFWLLPGNRELNKYGDTPRPPTLLLKIGSFLLITVLVAAITYTSLHFLVNPFTASASNYLM